MQVVNRDNERVAEKNNPRLWIKALCMVPLTKTVVLSQEITRT
jgi:hypothetical protein